MQTFLPHPDFTYSAITLDRARLGKQRSEVLQLLRGQWANHPASRMWRGHKLQLALYGVAICDEWLRRGYVDTCRDKILAEVQGVDDTGLPFWFGDVAFHRAHQSNLLRKMPEHYGPLFPNVPNDLPYVWPV